MDLDLDDQPERAAAAVVRAGARFKPKGKPLAKKKQVSFSTSQTTQSKDSASLDGSSDYPNKASTSETIVSESETVNKSTSETISEESVDILSRGVNLSSEPSLLRPCSNVDLEGKQCHDGIELSPTFPNEPKTQHSATDEDIYAQPERMQTEEENCHLDMETLDIVHDERITNAYEQHTGKFQPKPRLLDTVIQEPESHYSVDDTVFFTMDTNNEPEFIVNDESRKDFNTNTTFYGDPQEEELNIPEVPIETVPEMETQNGYGGMEHEEQVVSPSTNNSVEEERSEKQSKGKSKKPTTRKRKKTSEEETNKAKKNPEKKKFKHASRRQKRTLEKELLETPEDEIRFLPIRDMLRLVEYKEWLEKKEAKGAVEPPTQESNTNAAGNQYRSEDFGAEDEFGREDGENQENNVVKPDSPINYQTYMKKTSRTRWSKEDTELFYEGIQEFGSNLSMVQQLFPNRTREQIKLKFKLEERRNPLKIDDALSTRSKHLTHFQTVIKKLQEESAAARAEEEEEEEGEEGGVEAETTTDVPENEELTKSEETERASGSVAGFKESDGEDVENVVKSDGGDECDDDEGDDFFSSYKSEIVL